MKEYVFSPRVDCGRRSRRPLGLKIIKMADGLDDPTGYFPDSEEECSSIEFSASGNDDGGNDDEDYTVLDTSTLKKKAKLSLGTEQSNPTSTTDYYSPKGTGNYIQGSNQSSPSADECGKVVDAYFSKEVFGIGNEEVDLIQEKTITQESVMSPKTDRQYRWENESGNAAMIQEHTASAKGDKVVTSEQQNGRARKEHSSTVGDYIITQESRMSPIRDEQMNKEQQSTVGSDAMIREGTWSPIIGERTGKEQQSERGRRERENAVGNDTITQGNKTSHEGDRWLSTVGSDTLKQRHTPNHPGDRRPRRENRSTVGTDSMIQGHITSPGRGARARRERQSIVENATMKQGTPASRARSERMKAEHQITVGTDTMLDNITYENNHNSRDIQPQQQTHYIIIERGEGSRRHTGMQRRQKGRRGKHDDYYEYATYASQNRHSIKPTRDFHQSATVSTATSDESSDEDLTEKKKMIHRNRRRNASRLMPNNHKRAASSNQNERRIKKTRRRNETEYDRNDVGREEIETGLRSRKPKAIRKRMTDQENREELDASLKRSKNEQPLDGEESSNESAEDIRFDRLKNDKSVNRVKSIINNDSFNVSRNEEVVGEEAGCAKSPLPIDHVIIKQNENAENKGISKPKRKKSNLNYPKRKSSNNMKNKEVMIVQRDLEKDDEKSSNNKDKTRKSTINREQHNHHDSDIAGKYHSKQNETPRGIRDIYTPKANLSAFRMESPSALNTSWVGPSPMRSPYWKNSPAAQRSQSPIIPLQSSEKRKRVCSSPHQKDGFNTLPGCSNSDTTSFTMSNGVNFEDAIELNGPNEAGVNEAEVKEEQALKSKNRRKKGSRVAMPRKKATNKVKLCGLELSAARHQRILEETDDVQTIRRGKRTRVAPVHHWNVKERVKYERRKSGPIIKEVPKREDPPTKKRKQKTIKRATIKRIQESTSSEPENMYENVNPVKKVMGDDDEVVDMSVIFTPSMLNLVAPGKMPDGREITDILLHKFCSQRMFSAGIFVLLPLAEKGLQFVQEGTLLFHILNGEIDVTIGSTIDTIGKGCTFFIPNGNVYNIANPTRQTEAKILFFQIKG